MYQQVLSTLKDGNPELKISNNRDYIQDDKCTRKQGSWGDPLHDDVIFHLHFMTIYVIRQNQTSQHAHCWNFNSCPVQMYFTQNWDLCSNTLISEVNIEFYQSFPLCFIFYIKLYVFLTWILVVGEVFWVIFYFLTLLSSCD